MAKVLHPRHFPFCAENGSSSNVGPDTYYPISTTLAKAMEWYWKVRNWNLALSVTFIVGETEEGDPILETLSLNFNFKNNTIYDFGNESNSPTNEKDLVCPKYSFIENSDSNFDQYNFQLFAEFSFDIPIYKISNSYYPFIFFGAGRVGSAFSTRTDYTDSGMSSGGTFVLDGRTIPTFISGNVAEATCTITPIEYWPYEEED